MRYKPDLGAIAGTYSAGVNYRNDTRASTSHLTVKRLGDSACFSLQLSHQYFDEKGGEPSSQNTEPRIVARFHAFLPHWSAYLLAIHRPKHQKYILLRSMHQGWEYEGGQCIDFYNETYATRARGNKVVLATDHRWTLHNSAFSPQYRNRDYTAVFAALNNGLADFFDACNPAQVVQRDYISQDGYNWQTTLPCNRPSQRLNAQGCGLFLYFCKEELGGMPQDLNRQCQETAVYGLSAGALEMTICEDLDEASEEVRMPEKIDVVFYSEASPRKINALKKSFDTCLAPYGWRLQP